MNGLFASSILATDDNYIALRDDPKFVQLRKYCERLWDKFSPFADTSFPDEFTRQLHSRFFEMYLGNQLLEMGFILMPRETVMGPDLHFMINSTHVWIEAIAPNEGDGDDTVPDIMNHSRFEPIPEEKIILRFTNAISAKQERLVEYIKKRIVGLNDAYIVAINSRSVPIVILNADPIPAIVKSVYPVGKQIITLDTQKFEIISEQFEQRNEVYKENKSPVSTRCFLDPNYSGISGVLYSEAALWDLPESTGSDFKYIHNYLANSPMEKGWMKASNEWWWERDRLYYVKNPATGST